MKIPNHVNFSSEDENPESQEVELNQELNHLVDSKEMESDDNSDSSLEDELENLAAKFGRNRSDFLQDEEYEIDKNFDPEHESKSPDLKISAEEKLQRFADLKLVSIHPQIRNEIEANLDSIRLDVGTLKKFIKSL